MFERLIVARHGQTLDNARGVAQGWSDSELSQAGIEQARLLAARLRVHAPTSIYSSTLPRARKTARIIADELSLGIVELDELRELNCGVWEGVSFEEVRRTDTERFRAWISDPTVPCPGGESFAQLSERLGIAMERIAERELAAGGSPAAPLIVSHGLAIRVLASRLLGFPIELARNLLQDNASINLFEWRGDRFVLRTWNDVSHHENGR